MNTKHSLFSNMLFPEQRQPAVDEIINFFRNERGEEIGVIAAEAILDYFLETVGKSIYNKGVKDAQKILEQRLGDFAIDLEGLVLEEPPIRNQV